MRKTRTSHIVYAILATVAVVVLFVTYGTVLPAVPFAPVSLNGPTVVDSDGEATVVVDTESRRALIMNAEGDMTGVIDCTTADSPVNAITDACVSDGLVYVSGVRFAPDSDVIDKERVAVYSEGGAPIALVFEKQGDESTIPLVKSLSDIPDGVAVAYESYYPQGVLSEGVGNEDESSRVDDAGYRIVFEVLGTGEKLITDTEGVATHDAAMTDDGSGRYVLLSARGVLDDGVAAIDSNLYAGRVFTSIDVGNGAYVRHA